MSDIRGSVDDDVVGNRADAETGLTGSGSGDFRSGIRNEPPDKIPARLNFLPNLLLGFLDPTSLSSLEAILTASIVGVTSSQLRHHSVRHF